MALDVDSISMTMCRRVIIIAAALASVAAMASDGDTLRVLFAGDVLLDRGVRQKIDSVGVDGLFSPQIDSLFAEYDMVVANLECPATHVHAPVQKKYIFRADPEYLEPLRRHGVTHLNLANNHSIDQGRRGLLDTRDNILRAGMTPLGAGENMEMAAQPLMLATQPRKVWLLASLRLALENYAYLPHRPCVSQEEFGSLVARVAQLRRDDPNCVIIVTLHWGGENTMHPILQQVVDAHRLVDAGADVIVGHHPHTLQKKEVYHGKTVFYSIGNFIFDANREIHREACVAGLQVTAHGVDIQQIPIKIKSCMPYITQLR